MRKGDKGMKATRVLRAYRQWWHELFVLVVVSIAVLAVAGVAVASVEMNVPVYKQGYPSPWYNDQLGTCSETIGSAGCAITSIAVVFKYYGVQTDPRDMNNWLKQNNGYTSECLADWPVAAGRSGGTVQWAGRYNYTSIPADLNRINSELNNEYPVIAEVRLSGSQHFVVITGYSGSTYYINDPCYGDKSTINERYGNPTSAIYGIRLYHGTAADTPIPLSGDLNGDGTDSYGNFDPSTAGFTFNGKTVNFGTSTDLPVMGDWDHDGKDEIGLYRPDDGGQSKFYLITRDWASLSGPAGAADKTIPFGPYPDNIPIAGDWDGDGDDDIGGYYPGTFYLYLLNLGSSTATSYEDVPFGNPDDIPLIGDWDCDGDDDVGVCRRYDQNNNPTYYFDLDLTGVEHEIGPCEWGNNEDIPIAGCWGGDGCDKIGVYRPSTKEFIRNYDIPQIQECDGTDTSCGIYPNCENCNDRDGWYCNGNIREYRDFYCSGSSCTYTVTSSDNCDNYDGWMDTGNTKWVDVNDCREKEQKEQDYRDYYCSGGACTYGVTGTQWIDTGNTRNKPDGTICDCTASNTLKRCYSGVCTDTGICDATTCGADAACDGKRPGDSCGSGICDSVCECQAVGEDIAVFRNGLWYVDTDLNNVADMWLWHGIAGDIPLVGDFNNDGTPDIAVWRNGIWHIDTDLDNVADMWLWHGIAGDIPLVGDFNNDGTSDIAVFRNGLWYVDTDLNNVADMWLWHGIAGDIPLVGDFNNDGTSDIAVFRNGIWYIDTDLNNVADMWVWYGMAGDVPLVGEIG